ncbi:hypothetical protein TcCL_NonESM05777 [Trypanosoma cruzi]|nr:hypothetical protein TcCL_NonESM05777 [Trypanosoma cruzi]
MWATDTPAHWLFLLPMVWPSFTSTNTPVPQLCVPLTQATQGAFRQSKIQHLRKTVEMLAEATRLLNAASSPPHDSSMRRKGVQAALVSQKTANGSGFQSAENAEV